MSCANFLLQTINPDFYLISLEIKLTLTNDAIFNTSNCCPAQKSGYGWTLPITSAAQTHCTVALHPICQLMYIFLVCTPSCCLLNPLWKPWVIEVRGWTLQQIVFICEALPTTPSTLRCDWLISAPAQSWLMQLAHPLTKGYLSFLICVRSINCVNLQAVFPVSLSRLTPQCSRAQC